MPGLTIRGHGRLRMTEGPSLTIKILSRRKNYGNFRNWKQLQQCVGSTYTAQKNETVKKTETKEAAPAQAKNTGTDSVSDYYSYLQKNYDCVKNGSVAISGSYLKGCARNPEKAKELEENLSFFKEGYESGLKSA